MAMTQDELKTARTLAAFQTGDVSTTMMKLIREVEALQENRREMRREFSQELREAERDAATEQRWADINEANGEPYGTY